LSQRGTKDREESREKVRKKQSHEVERRRICTGKEIEKSGSDQKTKKKRRKKKKSIGRPILREGEKKKSRGGLDR